MISSFSSSPYFSVTWHWQRFLSFSRPHHRHNDQHHHHQLKKNNSTLCAGSSGSAFANFGVYQQTPVELNEISIRSLVSDNISVDSYRKALIAKLYFHKILSLTDSPSISCNDVMATFAAYFDINTSSANVKPKQPLNLSFALFFTY